MKKCLLLLCLLTVHSASAVELYEPTSLLAEASVRSKVVGVAPQGEVSVLERKGFWAKVQSPTGLQGWTQLSNLNMKDEEVEWMRPIDTMYDTGRLAGH